MSEPLRRDHMTTEEWLAWAEADADTRGLPELKPLLAALAAAQRRLRAADWNQDAPRGSAPPGEAAARPDAPESRP